MPSDNHSQDTDANTGAGRLPAPVLAAYAGMLRLCDILVGITLAVEVALISINVTARGAFNYSWGWMDEICQYTLLWLVTLGTVSLMDRYALFYAEVLLLFIKRQAIRKAIFIFNSIALIIFFAVVLKTGIDYVRAAWTFELDYSETPKYWFYMAMPIWGALMLMVVSKKLICMEVPDVTEVEAES
jgi:TRAP-type C4-dicarboxylate transport system permease small subunit